MQKRVFLVFVICFVQFRTLNAELGALDIIFGDSFKKPRSIKCNADFTVCQYLKDGPEGVIYITEKLYVRNGDQKTAPSPHIRLPGAKLLSGIPGNQHYSHPLQFPDLGRRQIRPDIDLAPPEVILKALADKYALQEAAKPKGLDENNAIEHTLLRSGNNWDDVWQEALNVKKMPRNDRKEAIPTDILPGSKLYNVIVNTQEQRGLQKLIPPNIKPLQIPSN